ncbi:MAG TPA: zf-HC2 domain-containing protein [Myxococcota bacterium]|jgi:hypothetical protein|nr:zf-HC2 domain-containing protein [Myxococcota bacterium]
MVERMGASECPAEVLDLLPWYPDGGLTSEERGLVEAHAALCPECRRELQSLHRGATLPEHAPSPERVLARVFDRIVASGASSDTPPQSEARMPAPAGVVAPLRRRPALEGSRAGVAARPRRHRTPARWRPGWAAAAALALVLGASLGLAAGRWLRGHDPAYRTASAPAVADVEGGPALDVVLRDDVPAGRVRDMLRAVGAQIVQGPSPLGRYELRLPPGTDAAAVAAVLSAQGTGIASFAQPMP